ncbi:2-amino-4-hydroxy-6-hydroxymethyldihydropteridine diphosphokinase [Cyanobium sp. Alchichica 3B3-8F6]|uniref:2-amino-4-hydroxy-6- hydroxymethyldihydropteridine diphosphokinase n=1 Tax=Cyanobium sp. Alchichica 3B3-8F6 TaxID=2823696 RepID=UPI0020CB6A78|nr:2-amino-4-hydroxy-6-hydroxymethyldihydropteridine diphosphokinase [Cyanobium sp. Alchichica 3B3-8F6]MCP9881774.1 2-amino-4-hydroxy-6-hydroxymethyldihydropteridine diphosphokinase [Cyanobium sp. Alchichica 3B3-8F6]
MRASLADQTGGGATPSLAIALGANLPSRCGNPIATLIAVRPLLEASVRGWSQDLRRPGETTAFRWSPLFETQAVGGPPGQPNYVNAVVLVEGASVAFEASADAAEDLLEDLQELEQRFGRERQERWGPRSLDLDLLWWGDLRCHTPRLQLPHPLWRERDFVLAPLAALERTAPGPGCTAVALAGQPGWPEQLEAASLTRTAEPPAGPAPNPR